MPFDYERKSVDSDGPGKGSNFSVVLAPGNIQMLVEIIKVLLKVISWLKKGRPLRNAIGIIRESEKYSEDIIKKVEDLIKESERSL